MKNYTLVDSEIKLKKLHNKMEQLEEFSFDTETNTLRVVGTNKDFKLVGISISWGDYDNYYIPIGHILDKNNVPVSLVVKYLKPIFEKENITVVCHNAKFDFHVLARIGIKIKTLNIFDTMVAKWLCDENTEKGLKYCTENILGIQQTKIDEVFDTVPKEIKKEYGLKGNQRATFDLVKIEDGYKYALDDAYYTWKLYEYLLDELEKEDMVDNYYNVYPKFLMTLFNMEERGVTVDIEKLKHMQVEMDKDLDELLYKAYSIAGVKFNLSSSQQLAELLHGYTDSKNPNHDIISVSFNFPVVNRTKKGMPQTNTESLKAISNNEYKTKRKLEGIELINILLEYKKINKLKTAFVDGMLIQMYDDNKVHPSFNIVGCLVGETLIPTTDGLKPISSINKNLIDNKPVDTTLTILNKDRELENTKYLIKFENEETIKIKTTLGLDIEGSKVHPIICSKYTPKKNSHRYRKYLGTEEQKEWKKLKDIQIGDRIAVPINYNLYSNKYVELGTSNLSKSQGKIIKTPKILDEDVAEFIGIYYADGSLHDSNGSFSIRITNGNIDVINRLNYLVPKLFGIIPRIYNEPRKNSKTVEITAKALSYIETEFELKRGCINKIIPTKILNSPKSVIQGFIKGLTLDSCVIKEGKYKTYLKFTLSNSISAKYLQEILLNMGIISSKTQDKSKTNNVFNLNIYNEEFEKFKNEIGFIESEKYIEIELNPNSSSNYTLIDNTLWVVVKHIEAGVNDVYDFNVPTSHSFVSGAFISHNTDSGRISCSSPNLQQLPKAGDNDKYQIRSVFIGSNNNKIIAVDYNNLEMVILAHFSNDENLTKCFKHGHDSHGDTAVNMFNLDCTADECKKKYPLERNVGKTLNFGLMYGMSSFTLCSTLEKSGVNMSDPTILKKYKAKNKEDLAQIYTDKYFNSYKGVAKFIRNQKKLAHRQGYVQTLTGRKRRLTDINSSNFALASYNERLSVNSCVQGSAGDITINAQNRLEFNEKLQELGCKMLIQIHDEVVFECPEENCEKALVIIKQLMEHPFGDNINLNVPLRVSYDVGHSYQDAK